MKSEEEKKLQTLVKIITKAARQGQKIGSVQMHPYFETILETVWTLDFMVQPHKNIRIVNTKHMTFINDVEGNLIGTIYKGKFREKAKLSNEQYDEIIDYISKL
jgi:hypothetical protein